MLIHHVALSCEPVYTDDGQEIDFYRDCGDRTCASSSQHSAAESSQRRQ